MQSSKLLGLALALLFGGAVHQVDAAQRGGQAPQGNVYDFVVVGGGTAGLALASRLAENGVHQVAVIEAGGDPDEVYPLYDSTPATAAFGTGGDPADTVPIDWNLVTVPQAGLGGRSIHYARGKCLGGSSMRHLMVHIRGTSDSYDKWESLGNPGWGWSDVLPFFEKSVKLMPPNKEIRGANATPSYIPSAYSKDGPMELGFPNGPQVHSSYVKKAISALGIKEIPDFNNGKQIGAQYPTCYINSDQNRSSTFNTFYAHSRNYPNLVVLKNSLAKRILFKGKTATGVAFTAANETSETEIYARKEVVVSGGTFHSPQILQVSGIGPKSLLERYKIPVIVDNPNVGQNLQDHPWISLSYRVNTLTATELLTNATYQAEMEAEYLTDRTGPFTNGGADFMAFERYAADSIAHLAGGDRLNSYPALWPTMEYAVSQFFLKNFSFPTREQPTDGYQYSSMLAILQMPLSRGNVTINSADSAVPPIINPGLLSHETDARVLVQGLRRMRKVFAAKEMQPILADPKEYFPGPAVQTDEEILKFVKENAMTLWHAASTCAMLPRNAGGVVDSQLRVYGVNNLRVADASIFPILTPGHPTASIYMVAEKAAALILSTHY